MHKLTKRTTAIVAASVLAVGGAGAAAWAAGWFKGSGEVSVSTSEIKNLTATVTLDGNMYPGKTTNATATVKNTNDYPITLTGITNLQLEQTGGTGCTIGNSKLTATLPPSAPTINSDATYSVPIPVTMGMDADEKCSGSVLKFKFDLTGAVAASPTPTTTP